MLQPVVAEIVSAQGRIISCQGVSVMNPDNNGSSSFFHNPFFRCVGNVFCGIINFFLIFHQLLSLFSSQRLAVNHRSVPTFERKWERKRRRWKIIVSFLFFVILILILCHQEIPLGIENKHKKGISCWQDFINNWISEVENKYFLNLRTSEIHLFYNIQVFYWHFLWPRFVVAAAKKMPMMEDLSIKEENDGDL